MWSYCNRLCLSLKMGEGMGICFPIFNLNFYSLKPGWGDVGCFFPVLSRGLRPPFIHFPSLTLQKPIPAAFLQHQLLFFPHKLELAGLGASHIFLSGK